MSQNANIKKLFYIYFMKKTTIWLSIIFKNQYNIFQLNGKKSPRLHSTPSMVYWNKYRKNMNCNSF